MVHMVISGYSAATRAFRTVREGLRVDSAQHTQLVNFIWGIADDVLRDVYVKGKYRDVILPMVVIRLDSVLERETDAL
jgi:type I restriction enzyme M protein